MAGDAYYNSVSLSLHGDGVNGSTVIVDHSPVPKTVTANGNAQISTAQSNFGGASILFDGSGDYLSIPLHASLYPTTDDFTVEGWLYISSIPGVEQYIGGTANSGGGAQAWGLSIGTDGKFYFTVQNSGGSYFTVASTAAFASNTWTHFAAVKVGMVLSTFVGGQKGAATATVTGSVVTPTGEVAFGRLGALNAQYFSGRLDDLRITKGVARYTADFTPPSTAHPDGVTRVAGQVRDDINALCARIVRAYNRITGALAKETWSIEGDPSFHQVSLLCHFDGANESTTFIDSSVAVPKTITANGNVKLSTSQAKSGMSSGLFDGSGDYLRIPLHASLYPTTDDFTFECWVYITSTPGATSIIAGTADASGGAQTWVAYVNTSGEFVFDMQNTGGTSYFAKTTALPLNAWNHVAGVKSGTSIKAFLNGTVGGTVGTLVGSLITPTGPVCVGREGNYNGFYFSGRLDDLRITKGVARYTADFTVPGRFPDKLVGALGDYELWLPTGDEHNIIFLDDDAGSLYNDIIDRVIPA